MPDTRYWNDRYVNKETGWDIGYVSTPLKAYFDQLTNRDISVLIPGGGNSYEAECLFHKGFNKVFVVDYSNQALDNFLKRVPDFPPDHWHLLDFFDLSGQYDLLIEQTFFCALDPALRLKYAEKCNELLKPGGKLTGLLFDDPLNNDKPPYGGSKDEYLSYFHPYFTVRTFDRCYNSIAPRAGRELFVQLIKK